MSEHSDTCGASQEAVAVGVMATLGPGDRVVATYRPSARPVLRATLAADHRAADGMTGARYLTTFDQLLHEPETTVNDQEARAQLRDAVVSSVVAIAPEADPHAIPDDASLRDELDLDSMDFLNVVQGIHDRTGIDVPERDYPHLATLRTAVDYLFARLPPADGAP